MKENETIKYKGKFYPKEDFYPDNYTQKPVPRDKLTQCLYMDQRGHLTWVLSSRSIRAMFGTNANQICKSSIEKHPNHFIIYKNKIYVKGYKKIESCVKREKIYNLSNLVTDSNIQKNKVKDALFYPIGIEFETSNGELNEDYIKEWGIYKIYDGSIGGHEYVSIPYTEDTLGNYFNFLEHASIFTSVDKYCSIHINIGVGLYNPLFLVSLYKLYARIQDELDLLIPSYKRDFMFLAGKRKDHCKNLPYIPDINESKILNVLFETDSIKRIHDLVMTIPKYNQKWRYYAVNFTKFITNQNVLEFRILPSVYSSKYNFFFIYLFQALVKYAERYSDKILNEKIKIELDDVLEVYPKDLQLTLKDRMQNLKNLFFNLKYQNGFDTSQLEELSNMLDNDL